MDVAREHFLAGAGLADDQHRAVARGDAARQLGETLRARRIGDELDVLARRDGGADCSR